MTSSEIKNLIITDIIKLYCADKSEKEKDHINETMCNLLNKFKKASQSEVKKKVVVKYEDNHEEELLI